MVWIVGTCDARARDPMSEEEASQLASAFPGVKVIGDIRSSYDYFGDAREMVRVVVRELEEWEQLPNSGADEFKREVDPARTARLDLHRAAFGELIDNAQRDHKAGKLSVGSLIDLRSQQRDCEIELIDDPNQRVAAQQSYLEFVKNIENQERIAAEADVHIRSVFESQGRETASGVHTSPHWRNDTESAINGLSISWKESYLRRTSLKKTATLATVGARGGELEWVAFFAREWWFASSRGAWPPPKPASPPAGLDRM